MTDGKSIYDVSKYNITCISKKLKCSATDNCVEIRELSLQDKKQLPAL